MKTPLEELIERLKIDKIEYPHLESGINYTLQLIDGLNTLDKERTHLIDMCSIGSRNPDINPNEVYATRYDYVELTNWENYEKDNWKIEYRLHTYYVIHKSSWEHKYKIYRGIRRDDDVNFDTIQPAWFINFKSADEAKIFLEEKLGINKKDK
jgi:hypothetical protein